MHLYITN